jgi:hypothetical protein
MVTFTRFVSFAFVALVAFGQSGAGQDIQFPNNVALVRLRMDVRANAPYVGVKASGQGPFVFEVDTGSMTSPLASELAKEMGLEESNSTSKGTVEITFADGFDVPMPLDFASFAGLWPLTGRRIYGDLGYSILKHFVVEFDYEDGYLTLYDPKKYRYSGGGSSKIVPSGAPFSRLSPLGEHVECCSVSAAGTDISTMQPVANDRSISILPSLIFSEFYSADVQ